MAESIFEMLNKAGARTDIARERFMDDEPLMLKYIRKFPEEPTMERLREAVKAKDYAAAEKAVHALKGISVNLDFRPLSDVAVDMLEELRDGNIEDAMEAYAEVEKEYTKFCEVINNWKAAE